MTDASWVANLWAYSLQVGLLVLAMGAVLALLRVPSPRLRLVAWRVVLAAALLLPLQPWRITRADANASALAQKTASGTDLSLALTATATSGAPGAPDANATSAGATWIDALRATDAIQMLRTVGAPDRLAHIGAVGWTSTIVTVLVAGALCRLLWLAFGWHRLHRRLRRQLSVSPTAESTRAHVEADLQQTLGTDARVEWTDDLSQPMTFGIWPPVVLLPTRLAALPHEMQQAVICHELLHVRRRDWLWVLGEEVVRAAFWFHPAVWWLLDQLQAAREELVDRLTLRAIGRRRAYLEALIAFAAEPEEPIGGTATAFFRSRQLGRRIASLMREGTMTRTQRIATVLGLGLTLAAALAAGVITFPLQASAAAKPAMTVAASPARPVTETTPAQAQRESAKTVYRMTHEIREAGKPGPLEARARVLAEGTPPPKRVVDVPFTFPSELMGRLSSAVLQARVVLDASGTVVESRVLTITFTPVNESAGELNEPIKQLVDHTLDVVRQWRYDAIENAPLALTVTVNYDARGKKGQASDDVRRPVEKRAIYKKVTKPGPGEASMAGGPGGGVAGGVPGGVAGEGVPGGVSGGVTGGAPGSGVSGGVPGGVAGGAPGERRLLSLQPGETLRPRMQRPGVMRIAESGRQPPQIIEEVRPTYPPDAMAAKLQGRVMLDLEVGADGLVTDTQVVESVPGLDDAAAEAARKWRFAPTIVDGTAVPVIVTMTMVFTMR